jgi:hypothetical protein
MPGTRLPNSSTIARVSSLMRATPSEMVPGGVVIVLFVFILDFFTFDF